MKSPPVAGNCGHCSHMKELVPRIHRHVFCCCMDVCIIKVDFCIIRSEIFHEKIPRPDLGNHLAKFLAMCLPHSTHGNNEVHKNSVLSCQRAFWVPSVNLTYRGGSILKFFEKLCWEISCSSDVSVCEVTEWSRCCRLLWMWELQWHCCTIWFYSA